MSPEFKVSGLMSREINDGTTEFFVRVSLSGHSEGKSVIVIVGQEGENEFGKMQPRGGMVRNIGEIIGLTREVLPLQFAAIL